MHPTQLQPDTAEVDTTPARVLRDAATYLDRHGWTQSTFYTYRDTATMPAACALGAIRMAVYGYPVDCSQRLADAAALRLTIAAIQLLAEQIGVEIDPDDLDPVDEIAQWNDRSDRTRFDVVEALRTAGTEPVHIPGGVA
jgi:hypothetical protein